jgi:hypothetical protein
MASALFSALSAILLLAGAADAQSLQFRWQPKEILTYRVEHRTTATEVIGDAKTETRSRLNLVKRWQVVDIDATGIATVQLSLAALRLETTTPKGDVLLFDSEDESKSDPHLKETLGKFLGQPYAILRINPQGKVIEVKESRFGPASRYESEPPFGVVFPVDGSQLAQNWEREYAVTLEPPQGTGEKFPAVQKYTSKTNADATITINLSTVAKSMPENPLDRIPVLQQQPEGTLTFDPQTGRMLSANLHIEKELKEHQGAGSSYSFQSTYKEELEKTR